MSSVVKHFSNAPQKNSITIICVFRDEELLLPKFIEHYEKMGATHFIFINNGSIDKSLEKIFTHCTQDFRIINKKENYSESNFGIDWATQELDLFCKNQWCGVIDIDEFIVLKDKETFSDLRNKMLSENSNICEFILCDFYPKNFPRKIDIFDPFLHSNYYDNFESKNNFNICFYQNQDKGSFGIWGGLRKRLFCNKKSAKRSYCLNKKLFYFYDFYEKLKLSAGMHWLEKKDSDMGKFAKYFSEKKIVAHFKFVKPDIIEFFKKRILRNQDWKDCEEYKSYVKNFKNCFFESGFSEKFSDPSELYKKTIDVLFRFGESK